MPRIGLQKGDRHMHQREQASLSTDALDRDSKMLADEAYQRRLAEEQADMGTD